MKTLKEGVHENLKTYIKLELCLLISKNIIILYFELLINFRRSSGILRIEVYYDSLN